MKRIVRLTESDLTRIVKRVISEQDAMSFANKLFGNKSTGQSVADSVKYYIEGASITNWWNKDDILGALGRLKTQADYNECKKNLNSSMTVYNYIESKLGTSSYDKSQSASVKNPLKGLGTGLTDEEFNDKMWSILSKFSQ